MKETSKQALVFAKCFQLLRMLLGDWHAVLTMLGSINKIFWDTLLAPFLAALGWKKIYKDLRNCYFDASHLVKYVYSEMLGMLMQTCVVDNVSNLQEIDVHRRGTRYFSW